MSQPKPIKEIKLEVVENGFVLRCNETWRTFAFEKPATLVAWMEKWAVERKKEMGK